MKQILRLREGLCPEPKPIIHPFYKIFLTFIVVLVSCVCSVAQVSASSPEAGPAAGAVEGINGRIVSAKDGKPLQGATVKLKNTNLATLTNENGEFSLPNRREGVLEISFLGYVTEEVPFSTTNERLTISLEPDEGLLEEVMVSTGYQEIPKERATGSFVQIDNELLNRRVSTDILTKLNGITSGVYFNGTGGLLNANYTLPESLVSVNPNNKLGINIRGQSTISNLVSKDPLIVLDNFPYEGDINNLNPDMVESVTVLKDAAAASIWGARAANGVIVIKTKKGKFNERMQMDISINTSIGAKPDIFYDRGFLQAPAYISIEEDLYKKGYLDNDINNNFLFPAVSPAVLAWEQLRTRKIPQEEARARIEEYKNQDIRKDIQRYVYRNSLNQQYAVSARGGAKTFSYAFNVGYDNVKTNLKRNGYDRIAISSSNVFKPTDKMELTFGTIYSRMHLKSNNAFPWGSSNYNIRGSSYFGFYPYARLADGKGNNLSIEKKLNAGYIDSVSTLGFLDWRYSPLNEIAAADNNTKQYNLILRAGLNYNITSYLDAGFNFQSERQTAVRSNHYSLDSYYARDLINRFTQVEAGTDKLVFPVPKNGVLNMVSSESITNNFRGQLNFSKTFKTDHAVSAFIGSEVREVKGGVFSRTSYGYDSEHGTSVDNLDYVEYYNTNAGYGGNIPPSSGAVSGTVNRFISYYANGSYAYRDKYVVTASARRDGANLFGTNTNHKFAPLWSAGIGWNLSNEKFYHSGLFPYLKLRATIGYNGNVYNGIAYTTGSYRVSRLTQLQAMSSLVAPNPELRWEKVKNINVGVDFRAQNDWLSGSVDIYIKKGTDLIDEIPLAASSGFTSFIGNAASTETKGVDLTLNSRILKKDLHWGASLLLSALHDKVLEYNVEQTAGSIQTNAVAMKGGPLHGVYSYRWAGLNPDNGNPRGFLNGQVSEDYPGILNNYNPDSLVYHGSAVPRLFMALRNDFSFRGFSLSWNLVYKGGYYFRRRSTQLGYLDVIYSGGHSDAGLRWKKQGDEKFTQVPSLIYTNDRARNTFYTYSELLVEKGDHLRLQDIRLGYTIDTGDKTLFDQVQVFLYANNLGVLWRANKQSIDPEALGATLPNPRTVALGLKFSL